MSKEIKVMIIDDETLVRQGLIHTINWSKYNMRVVADEANGESGWDAFVKHMPDIVITDIVMPGQDGVAFARQIKAYKPDVKIVVLSCHRDFEYAQQFIHIGAAAYLLKTSFSDNELERYLQLFQDELQNKQSHADSGKSIKEWLLRPEPIPAPSLTDHLRALLGDRQYFAGCLQWLDRRTPATADITPALQAMSNIAIEHIDSYNWALIAADHHPHDEVSRQLSGYGMEESEWRLAAAGPCATPREALIRLKLIWRAEDIKRIYNLKNGYHTDLVTKAIIYIDDRLRDTFRSSEVAGELGLSRSHFSGLFRKVTGKSFIAFLSERRLEAAKSYLAFTNMKPVDIPARIGIPDYKYFSKWFKKHTGLTPSEYRAGQKGEPERTK